MRTPLNGYNDPDNAYLVNDYPYGSMRCRIKFWLEKKDSKGFRFVSQTENPKNGRWNAPKASTYSSLGGAMYLDEKGHCGWAGLSSYSDEKEVKAFLADFPDADTSLLRPFALAKAALYRATLKSGKVFAINGERADLTAKEVEDYTREAEFWTSVGLDKAAKAA